MLNYEKKIIKSRNWQSFGDPYLDLRKEIAKTR